MRISHEHKYNSNNNLKIEIIGTTIMDVAVAEICLVFIIAIILQSV